MRKIFKYEPMVVNKVFDLEVPHIFTPIAFQTQRTVERDEVPTLWAIVDPESFVRTRKFLCIGTGISFPEEALSEFVMGVNMDYIGTAQAQGFVWHLFWEGYGQQT